MDVEESKKKFLSSLFWQRIKSDYTQVELAQKLGMQQSAIARIESGQGNPSLKTLLKITEALDVNLVLEYKHGKNFNHR